MITTIIIIGIIFFVCLLFWSIFYAASVLESVEKNQLETLKKMSDHLKEQRKQINDAFVEASKAAMLSNLDVAIAPRGDDATAITVCSELNYDISFTIVVKNEDVWDAVKLAWEGFERWNDPDKYPEYHDMGYAEPSEILLKEAGIEYELVEEDE